MSAPNKPMKYVRLGKSGLKVSQIILGTLSYGHYEWADWLIGEKEGIEHIKFAFDHGINTFDTANVYSNGESERILGKALKVHKIPREEVVIMTKLFHPAFKEKSTTSMSMGIGPKLDEAGYVNRHGLSRKNIFASVKASLERLGVEYFDVLQCHRFDPHTPIEETMRALHDVVQAGYARYIGMSSCWAWQFHAMQNYAIQNNLTPFVSMRNHHNLIYREEEREMIPLLEHLGVGIIPWSPIARGVLTRPWGTSTKRAETDARVNGFYSSSTCARDTVGRVEEIANKKGVKMAQISIAWSLKKVTAPIVGTTKLENLKEMIDAINIELTDEEVKYLEELYKPSAVIGHR